MLRSITAWVFTSMRTIRNSTAAVWLRMRKSYRDWSSVPSKQSVFGCHQTGSGSIRKKLNSLIWFSTYETATREAKQGRHLRGADAPEAKLRSTVIGVANSSVQHARLKPRGHPGLWAADGGLHISRSYIYMPFLFLPFASFACDSPLSQAEIIIILVHSFICNRIDYCNSVLYGASLLQLDHLQSILNAAARIILRMPKFSHISASIRCELHWLPVRFRPEFKICLFVRNCLSGAAPAYLQELCVAVSSSAGRRNLCSLFGESRGPRCLKSGYNLIWAARFLCFRAGHLELLKEFTTRSSTNYKQCWTV